MVCGKLKKKWVKGNTLSALRAPCRAALVVVNLINWFNVYATLRFYN